MYDADFERDLMIEYSYDYPDEEEQESGELETWEDDWYNREGVMRPWSW